MTKVSDKWKVNRCCWGDGQQRCDREARVFLFAGPSAPKEGDCIRSVEVAQATFHEDDNMGVLATKGVTVVDMDECTWDALDENGLVIGAEYCIPHFDKIAYQTLHHIILYRKNGMSWV